MTEIISHAFIGIINYSCYLGFKAMEINYAEYNFYLDNILRVEI